MNSGKDFLDKIQKKLAIKIKNLTSSRSKPSALQKTPLEKPYTRRKCLQDIVHNSKIRQPPYYLKMGNRLLDRLFMNVYAYERCSTLTVIKEI